MELITLVIGLISIINSGALTKVGEKIAEVTSIKILNLLDLIQTKSPQSQTAKSLAAGQELDPQQTIIDIKLLAQDSEVRKILAEIEALIVGNKELKAKLDMAALKMTKNIQINQGESGQKNREDTLTPTKIELMQFSERAVIPASVVFFFIPHLPEQQPNISYCALVSLHGILKNRLLEQGLKLRILSSISGAIAIIPDSSGIYIHQELSTILNDCHKKGVPVRLGITHGQLEVLKDADNSFNFIGIPVNIAARLSTSDKNRGILYHWTYSEHVKALPVSPSSDPLHPIFGSDLEIEGKTHDSPFNCREPENNNLVLHQFDNTLSGSSISSDPININGIAIAYDLPKFSSGDRAELSKRFRSVVDVIQKIKSKSIFSNSKENFFFSPGGDGGIIFLPIREGNSPEEYVQVALDLIECLEIESDNKDPNINVVSRVGIHYGVISIYQNAEGIRRPTGLNCFIADQIASDDLAKKKGGIVITENIKDSLFSGSQNRFALQYELLDTLKEGAARTVKRYVKTRAEEVNITSSAKSSSGGRAELDPSIESLVTEVRSDLHGKIQSNYGTIQVLNVARPIQLGHLYVNVDILSEPNRDLQLSIESADRLLVSQDPKKDFNRLGMPKSEKRVPGRQAVEDYSHIMVLGRPGAGKTTFLQYVAIDCNQGKLLPDFVPLLIRLRDIMPREGEKWSLSAAIVNELGDKDKANRLLEKGKILLLLDGLDEVPDGENENAIREIEEFNKSYYNNRLIVTCRLQAQPYQFPSIRFNYVEVAEFTLEQIQQFVTNWFGLASQQGQGNNKAEGLIAQLKSQEQIQKIVDTPILLSLACKVFNDDETSYSKPGELYRKGLELLLSEWNEANRIGESTYKYFDVPKRRDLLGEVALRKFKKPRFVLFKQDELEASIADYLRDRKSLTPSDVIGNHTAKYVLRDIAEQHGLLIERASKIWSFSHLPFQEYFAAEAISKLDYSIQGEAHNDILKHVTKQNWREVFFLTSEILERSDRADSLVLSIKKFADSLLAGNSELQKVLMWLYKKSRSITSDHEDVAIRALYLARFFTPALSLQNESVNTEFDQFRSLSSALDRNVSDSINSDLTVDRLMYYILRAIDSQDIRRTLIHVDHMLEIQGCDREIYSKLSSVGNQLRQLREHHFYTYTLFQELNDFIKNKRDLRYRSELSSKNIDLLSQYYVANDTLAYCISSSNVSDGVRQAIKETLLLPISEHY
jgi:NACHT domain